MRGDTTESSLRKPIANSNLVSQASKKLFFAHQATAGESVIDIASLVMPAELTAQGYVNPLPSEIAAANIYANKARLVVTSSVRGKLMKISYRVLSNSQIEFIGFTTEEDEIFEFEFETVPTPTVQVADARPLVQTYVLPAGETEVPVADYPVYQNPTKQIGSIQVFRGASMNLQVRNESNATASIFETTGNYQELPNKVKFNVPAGLGGEQIVIMSVGALTQREPTSLISQLELLRGRQQQLVNAIIEGLGTDSGYFTSIPTDVDLDSFGALVLALSQWKNANEGFVGENLSALKQYDLNITGAGWTTTRAKGVPYKTLDGSWRFRFNIWGSAGSAVRTVYYITIGGINCTTIGPQGILGGADTLSVPFYRVYIAGGGAIECRHASGTTDAYYFMGDVEIDGKPSFVP